MSGAFRYIIIQKICAGYWLAQISLSFVVLDGAVDFVGSQATDAYLCSPDRSAVIDFDGLDVCVPFPTGMPVGMGYIVSRNLAFSADFTFVGHFRTSFTQLLYLKLNGILALEQRGLYHVRTSIVKHYFTLLKGCLHIDDALIAAASELQLQVLFSQDKWAVYQPVCK